MTSPLLPDTEPETVAETETENEPVQKTMQKTVNKNSKILAVFAIICTAIVGLVYELTKNKIAQQHQLQLLSTLHSIIEPSSYNNDIANDCVFISSPLLGDKALVQTVYIARLLDENTTSTTPVSMAITTTATDGYSGNISMIVAMNMNNVISGVRVLQHQETPGLGDKVDERKSDWIHAFTGKSVLNDNDKRWAVAKDKGMFDQFTGATITPRAVVKAVKNASLYLQQNKDFILAQPNACSMSIEPTKNTDTVINEVKTHDK